MVNKLMLLAALLLLLNGCTSPSSPRPHPITETEQFMQRGNLLFQQGKYSDSLYFFMRGIEQYRSLDNQLQLQTALLNTSEVALLIGRLNVSETAATEAYNLSQSQSSEEHLQRASLVLTQIALLREQLEQARTYFAQAEMEARTGNVVESLLLINVELAIKSDELERARNLLSQDNVERSVLFQARQTQLQALTENDAIDVRSQLLKALELNQQQSFRPGIASVLTDLGEHSFNQGQTQEAIQFWERALFIRTWLKDPFRTYLILEKLVEANEVIGNQEEANRLSLLLENR